MTEKDQVEFPLTAKLLDNLSKDAPLYAPQIIKCYQNNSEDFSKLSEKMLQWGECYLGDNLFSSLIKGYSAFVSNVNRSQMQYEIKGSYEFSSYDEVFSKVYDNNAFMEHYHWGVYLTTFAWEHHLKLYNFFVQQFIKYLPSEPKTAIDLGAGSGIWSMLLADSFKNMTMQAVDISETSVNHATALIKVNKMAEQIKVRLDDALTFKLDEPGEIGISCFLIEHLESPEQLLLNLASNIKDNGYAFVTAALTAAEIDHIFEIRHESELILMAEKAGFRVISSFSSSPSSYPEKMNFLPRSMAMVLQKKHNPIW
jgi:2-polyprenyl-3-methyl-5-hydroxy-6-metoxy-1,4-benzoquinol methylase